MAEKRKAHKAEKARVDELLQQAAAFQQSRLIRDLVAAVRASPSSARVLVGNADVEAWIAWATQQADRLDPLRESPHSILDEDLPPEDPWSTYRRW